MALHCILNDHHSVDGKPASDERITIVSVCLVDRAFEANGHHHFDVENIIVNELECLTQHTKTGE